MMAGQFPLYPGVNPIPAVPSVNYNGQQVQHYVHAQPQFNTVPGYQVATAYPQHIGVQQGLTHQQHHSYGQYQLHAQPPTYYAGHNTYSNNNVQPCLMRQGQAQFPLHTNKQLCLGCQQGHCKIHTHGNQSYVAGGRGDFMMKPKLSQKEKLDALIARDKDYSFKCERLYRRFAVLFQVYGPMESTNEKIMNRFLHLSVADRQFIMVHGSLETFLTSSEFFDSEHSVIALKREILLNSELALSSSFDESSESINTEADNCLQDESTVRGDELPVHFAPQGPENTVSTCTDKSTTKKETGFEVNKSELAPECYSKMRTQKSSISGLMDTKKKPNLSACDDPLKSLDNLTDTRPKSEPKIPDKTEVKHVQEDAIYEDWGDGLEYSGICDNTNPQKHSETSTQHLVGKDIDSSARAKFKDNAEKHGIKIQSCEPEKKDGQHCNGETANSSSAKREELRSGGVQQIINDDYKRISSISTSLPDITKKSIYKSTQTSHQKQISRLERVDPSLKVKYGSTPEFYQKINEECSDQLNTNCDKRLPFCLHKAKKQKHIAVPHALRNTSSKSKEIESSPIKETKSNYPKGTLKEFFDSSEAKSRKFNEEKSERALGDNISTNPDLIIKENQLKAEGENLEFESKSKLENRAQQSIGCLQQDPIEEHITLPHARPLGSTPSNSEENVSCNVLKDFFESLLRHRGDVNSSTSPDLISKENQLKVADKKHEFESKSNLENRAPQQSIGCLQQDPIEEHITLPHARPLGSTPSNSEENVSGQRNNFKDSLESLRRPRGDVNSSTSPDLISKENQLKVESKSNLENRAPQQSVGCLQQDPGEKQVKDLLKTIPLKTKNQEHATNNMEKLESKARQASLDKNDCANKNDVDIKNKKQSKHETEAKVIIKSSKCEDRNQEKLIANDSNIAEPHLEDSKNFRKSTNPSKITAGNLKYMNSETLHSESKIVMDSDNKSKESRVFSSELSQVCNSPENSTVDKDEREIPILEVYSLDEGERMDGEMMSFHDDDLYSSALTLPEPCDDLESSIYHSLPSVYDDENSTNIEEVTTLQNTNDTFSSDDTFVGDYVETSSHYTVDEVDGDIPYTMQDKVKNPFSLIDKSSETKTNPIIERDTSMYQNAVDTCRNIIQDTIYTLTKTSSSSRPKSNLTSPSPSEKGNSALSPHAPEFIPFKDNRLDRSFSMDSLPIHKSEVPSLCPKRMVDVGVSVDACAFEKAVQSIETQTGSHYSDLLNRARKAEKVAMRLQGHVVALQLREELKSSILQLSGSSDVETAIDNMEKKAKQEYKKLQTQVCFHLSALDRGITLEELPELGLHPNLNGTQKSFGVDLDADCSEDTVFNGIDREISMISRLKMTGHTVKDIGTSMENSEAEYVKKPQPPPDPVSPATEDGIRGNTKQTLPMCPEHQQCADEVSVPLLEEDNHLDSPNDSQSVTQQAASAGLSLIKNVPSAIMATVQTTSSVVVGTNNQETESLAGPAPQTPSDFRSSLTCLPSETYPTLRTPEAAAAIRSASVHIKRRSPPTAPAIAQPRLTTPSSINSHSAIPSTINETHLKSAADVNAELQYTASPVIPSTINETHLKFVADVNAELQYTASPVIPSTINETHLKSAADVNAELQYIASPVILSTIDETHLRPVANVNADLKYAASTQDSYAQPLVSSSALSNINNIPESSSPIQSQIPRSAKEAACPSVDIPVASTTTSPNAPAIQTTSNLTAIPSLKNVSVGEIARTSDITSTNIQKPAFPTFQNATVSATSSVHGAQLMTGTPTVPSCQNMIPGDIPITSNATSSVQVPPLMTSSPSLPLFHNSTHGGNLMSSNATSISMQTAQSTTSPPSYPKVSNVTQIGAGYVAKPLSFEHLQVEVQSRIVNKYPFLRSQPTALASLVAQQTSLLQHYMNGAVTSPVDAQNHNLGQSSSSMSLSPLSTNGTTNAFPGAVASALPPSVNSLNSVNLAGMPLAAGCINTSGSSTIDCPSVKSPPVPPGLASSFATTAGVRGTSPQMFNTQGLNETLISKQFGVETSDTEKSSNQTPHEAETGSTTVDKQIHKISIPSTIGLVTSATVTSGKRDEPCRLQQDIQSNYVNPAARQDPSPQTLSKYSSHQFEETCSKNSGNQGNVGEKKQCDNNLPPKRLSAPSDETKASTCRSSEKSENSKSYSLLTSKDSEVNVSYDRKRKGLLPTPLTQSSSYNFSSTVPKTKQPLLQTPVSHYRSNAAGYSSKQPIVRESTSRVNWPQYTKSLLESKSEDMWDVEEFPTLKYCRYDPHSEVNYGTDGKLNNPRSSLNSPQPAFPQNLKSPPPAQQHRLKTPSPALQPDCVDKIRVDKEQVKEEEREEEWTQVSKKKKKELTQAVPQKTSAKKPPQKKVSIAGNSTVSAWRNAPATKPNKPSIPGLNYVQKPAFGTNSGQKPSQRPKAAGGSSGSNPSNFNSNYVIPEGKKASNYLRLIKILQDKFPQSSRLELSDSIETVRNRRGGLSGCGIQQIIEECRGILAMKSRTGLNMLEEDDEDPCVICHDGFSVAPTKKLECGHEFHDHCIRRWVNERERTCPTCRRHALFPEEFPQLGKR